jgi:hypothetical protein
MSQSACGVDEHVLSGEVGGKQHDVAVV